MIWDGLLFVIFLTMKQKIKVLGILLFLLNSNTRGQYLYDFTRLDSLSGLLNFEATLLNSSNNIIDLSANYVSANYSLGRNAPLVITEMDSLGTIINSRKILFLSDSLNFYCNGTLYTSGTQFALSKSLFQPLDSTYFFAGTLVARYFACPLEATCGFLKLDKNLNTIWFR